MGHDLYTIRMGILKYTLSLVVPDDYGVVRASRRELRAFPAVTDRIDEVLVAP